MPHLSKVFRLLIAPAITISLLMTAQSLFAAGKKPDEPMNIIYILTDDQRFDELGFMHPFLKTPNMDALAKKGVHFKNTFVTTALC